VPAADRAPALRGDKQTAFNAKTITVSDEYVLYGPAANAQALATVQSALNTYYNNPTFSYRNYQVVFQLTARLAVAKESNWFEKTTTWIHVETASASTRAWDIPPFRDIGIFDTSTADVIAHEVGHLLSDRVGIFSEGYSENMWERGKYVVGLGPGGATTIKPEAMGDIMSGPNPGDLVSIFSLSGILDNAINQHEYRPTLQGMPIR